MDRRIGIAQARETLEDLVREVRKGTRFMILDRGTVVAELTPPTAVEAEDRVRAVEALRAAPRIAGVPSEMVSGFIAEGRACALEGPSVP